MKNIRKLPYLSNQGWKVMASDLAINVTGVYKKYGRGRKAKQVLKGLNMEVPYNTM